MATYPIPATCPVPTCASDYVECPRCGVHRPHGMVSVCPNSACPVQDVECQGCSRTIVRDLSGRAVGVVTWDGVPARYSYRAT